MKNKKEITITFQQDELDLIFEIFGEIVCIGEFFEPIGGRWNRIIAITKKLSKDTEYWEKKDVLKTIEEREAK